MFLFRSSTTVQLVTLTKIKRDWDQHDKSVNDEEDEEANEDEQLSMSGLNWSTSFAKTWVDVQRNRYNQEFVAIHKTYE